MKTTLIVLLLTSFFFQSSTLLDQYVEKQINEDKENGFRSLIIAEKITFEETMKFLKENGYINNDGVLIYSGTKLMRKEEAQKLLPKYAPNNIKKKWKATDFKNQKLSFVSVDTISKVASSKAFFKSYAYQISDVFTTNDKKYKLHYVSKSVTIDYDASILFTCVCLYEKVGLKWHLTKTFDSRGLN